MPKVKLPRYVTARTLASGATAYYFTLPGWVKGAMVDGRPCPLPRSTALGSDTLAAIAQAERLLVAWDAWRAGEGRSIQHGSIAWLFREFMKSRNWSRLALRTRQDYDAQIKRLIDFPTNPPFGQLEAARVAARHADKLYERLCANHGDRQGAYAMQVCRLVWSWGARQGHVKDNPFASMGISLKPKRETREWTRAEYEAFKAKAREMDMQVMATAAALSFELVQRIGDVIGRATESGGIEGAMMWHHYRPGESFEITQNKTGRRLIIPMRDNDQARTPLFPELEAELAATPKVGTCIIMDTGSRHGVPVPMKRFKFNSLFLKVRRAAGLSEDLQFRALRHGGATELGDAGVQDIGPMSGHTTQKTAAIYNKRTTEAKAREAARKRLVRKRELLAEQILDAKGE